MDDLRNWHIAFPATAVVLAVVLVLVDADPAHRAIGLGTLVALTGTWFALGPRACDFHPERFSLAANRVFVVVVVLSAFVLTAVHPVLAIVQAIAFPAVWVFSASTRAAVVANVGVAVAVFAGFLVSQGTSPASVASAVLTEALSFGFSLVIGFWITRVSERSTERMRLLDELRSTQSQLAALSRDHGATAERERLAREIHDTLAQSLTGLVLLAQRARREQTSGDGRLPGTLELVEESARAALDEARALVAATASVDVPDARVDAALARLGARFERETGLEVRVAARGADAAELPRDAQVVLLRCAQEALANVRKHARAARVDLDLDVRAHGATLRICDDGVGFDGAARSPGFGLDGIRDRLALQGGALAVSSRPGRTELVVELPLTAATATAETGAAR